MSKEAEEGPDGRTGEAGDFHKSSPAAWSEQKEGKWSHFLFCPAAIQQWRSTQGSESPGRGRVDRRRRFEPLAGCPLSHKLLLLSSFCLFVGLSDHAKKILSQLWAIRTALLLLFLEKNKKKRLLTVRKFEGCRPV